ncbi:MAG: DinB family protein [Chloroflexi bacterium]|nr:MAG: DinB family protein [Chloroflexota bacterium]
MSDLLPRVESVLKTTPARWLTLTQTLPHDLLKRRPLPDEWSALECLLHVVDTERLLYPVRVKAILKGEKFPAFSPDEQGTKLTEDTSPVALAREFEALRTESLKLLKTLKSEDLSKEGVHGELGPVTMANLLNTWAGHDLMHLRQAEEALLQPFIDGCGPWLVYFESHRIATT